MSYKKQKPPRFKSKKEEAEFWMKHDTADFWDTFEDVKEPVYVSPNVLATIKARHERTKAISIRLYPSQLRIAKTIARETHTPYQSILRNLIEQGLTKLAHS